MKNRSNPSTRNAKTLLFHQQVARGRHVIHGGVRADAEHIVARLFLEDARRAAVIQHVSALSSSATGVTARQLPDDT